MTVHSDSLPKVPSPDAPSAADGIASASPSPSYLMRAAKRLDLALYHWLESEPEFERSDAGEKRRLDRSIRHHTGIVLFSCVLLMLMGPVLTPWGVILLAIIIVVALIALHLARLRLYSLLDIDTALSAQLRHTTKQRSDACHSLLAARLAEGKGLLKYNVFAWLTFVQPISFQNIWWWTLFIGVTNTEYIHSVALDAAGSTVPLQAGHLASVEDLTGKILATLVISAVAFIATNLVSHLLDLRDNFQLIRSRVDEANSAVGRLDKSLRSHIDNLSETSESSLDTLRAVMKTLEVGGRWIELKQRLTNKKVRDLWLRAVGMLDNLGHQIDFGSKDKIEPFLASVLGQFLQSQGQLLNTTQHRVVTKYENLGQMANELMELARHDSEMVVYALLVLPPLRYLNYNGSYRFGRPTLAKWAEENSRRELRSSTWWNYLNTNREIAVAPRVHVKRYFLSVALHGHVKDVADSVEQVKRTVLEADAFEDPAFRVFNEILPVRSSSVTSQLRLHVLCDGDRLPIAYLPATDDYLSWSEAGARLRQWREAGASENAALQFVVREQKDDFPVTVAGAQWLTLGEVLGTVFHKRETAWVLECEQRLDPHLSFLIDKDTMKLKDFFAIGKPNGGEVKWLLCLRSLYDRDFDVADVEIVYPESRDRWEVVKRELDQVFVHLPSQCRPVLIE